MEDSLLRSHSVLFSSVAKMVPAVPIEEDEEDSEEAGADDLGGKFSVEHVQSIGLRALQERLKEKLGEVPQRPSFVDDSGLVIFSKFDFTSSAHKEVQLAERKSMSKKKGYKKLLAKAEAAQRKLEELKKTDEKRGEELAKKLMWQKAMDMARGTKIKDNPKLLKKTVKKIEKRKKKTSKEWEERKNMEREAMEKRQAKRKANIEERKEQIRSKKIKRRMKKGKGRTPGF